MQDQSFAQSQSQGTQNLAVPTSQPIQQPMQSGYGTAATQAADPVSRAAAAITVCLARTANDPRARMNEIAAIKAAYLKEKFGIEIN